VFFLLAITTKWQCQKSIGLGNIEARPSLLGYKPDEVRVLASLHLAHGYRILFFLGTN
jgi:hypothetical protein